MNETFLDMMAELICEVGSADHEAVRQKAVMLMNAMCCADLSAEVKDGLPLFLSVLRARYGGDTELMGLAEELDNIRLARPAYWEHAKEHFGPNRYIKTSDGRELTFDELSGAGIHRVSNLVLEPARDMIATEREIAFYDDGRVEWEEKYSVQPQELPDGVPWYTVWAQRFLNDLNKEVQ